jgi:hypothetical protein
VGEYRAVEVGRKGRGFGRAGYFPVGGVSLEKTKISLRRKGRSGEVLMASGEADGPGCVGSKSPPASEPDSWAAEVWVIFFFFQKISLNSKNKTNKAKIPTSYLFKK